MSNLSSLLTPQVLNSTDSTSNTSSTITKNKKPCTQFHNQKEVDQIFQQLNTINLDTGRQHKIPTNPPILSCCTCTNQPVLDYSQGPRVTMTKLMSISNKAESHKTNNPNFTKFHCTYINMSKARYANQKQQTLKYSQSVHE